MKRALATVALVAMTVLTPTAADAAPKDNMFPGGLPWAQYGDACAHGVHRCVWDAKHRGDGKGASYVMTRYKGSFVRKRIKHKRAHKLAKMWCQRSDVACGYGE